MPDTIEYRVLEVPLAGRNLAASRSPRLQPSAVVEYSDMLSREVSAGRWTVDPENGEPLNSAGQNLAQHLEFTLKTRPHWFLPVVLEDDADKVWLAEVPSLTERGARLVQLEKHCGSKAAALVLFKEEAARYGITNPMSRQPGSKPGERKSDDKAAAGNLSRNPWSDKFTGSEAERINGITFAIKRGTSFADALAKSAGTVTGKPLRRAAR